MDDVVPEGYEKVVVRQVDPVGPQRPTGNGANRRLATVDAGVDVSSDADGQPAAFWRNRVADQQHDIVWFHPPIPTSGPRREQATGLVDELAGLLHGSPFRGWLLRWTHHTRSSAAQEELETLERETARNAAERQKRALAEAARLDGSLHDLEARKAAVERELESAEKAFADACARAGLIGAAMPSPGPDGRPAGGSPQTELQAALSRTAPTSESLAGRYRVKPVNGEGGMLRVLGAAFLDFLARLVSGFLLALCLGTLVGLVNLDDLKRPDLRFGDYLPFIISALLGFVIVDRMGKAYFRIVQILKHALEDRRATDAADLPPLHRGALGAAVTYLAVAVTFGISEVITEAAGLRMLHQERIQANNLLNGATEHLLPWSIYALIGLLISGPYLLYKATEAWNQDDADVRRAWLTHRRDEWLADRRRQPDVQDAFRWAGAVEELRAQRDALTARLDSANGRLAELAGAGYTPEETARLTDARSAAVGEAARLHQMVEQVVDTHEPLPRRATAAPPLASGNGR